MYGEETHACDINRSVMTSCFTNQNNCKFPAVLASTHTQITHEPLRFEEKHTKPTMETENWGNWKRFAQYFTDFSLLNSTFFHNL